MHSDRELLELAAKAVGGMKKHQMMPDRFANNYNKVSFKIPCVWDPLTSDGDALRLAVDLGLVVCIMRSAGFTGIYLPACSIGGKHDVVQLHGDDLFTATRRAIVRAAAAIGEAMQ